MKVRSNKTGREFEFKGTVEAINRGDQRIIPYCTMRERTCFDSAYWRRCPNFDEYILLGEHNE